MHPYSFLQLIISALATIPVVPLSDAAVIGENEIMVSHAIHICMMSKADYKLSCSQGMNRFPTTT